MGVCFWVNGGEFSERVHPSNAAGREHRVPAVTLSELQILDPLVFEYSAADVGLSARQVQELRRENFGALFFGGTADGTAVPGVLVELWAAIGLARAGVCDFFGGIGGGDVH